MRRITVLTLCLLAICAMATGYLAPPPASAESRATCEQKVTSLRTEAKKNRAREAAALAAKPPETANAAIWRDLAKDEETKATTEERRCQTLVNAKGPRFYTSLVKLEGGVQQPIISYGHLALIDEGLIPTECEIAASGYIENPVGEGPGEEVTEAFDAYNCHNSECEAAGGHIGVIYENEGSLGLRPQISWPAELTESKVGTIRLKYWYVAEYVHCQFGYTAPTETAPEEPFEGTEVRNTAEFNGGTKVVCTTESPGLQQPKEVSGTSPSKPAETEFDLESGKLECGLYKGETAGKLASEAFNHETNVPSAIQTKKE